MAIEITWNPEKAAENLQNHGVSFEETGEVFRDPLSRTIGDEEHSLDGEQRGKTIGYSLRGRLLVLIHTDEEYRIRMISARRPTRREREEYEGE